MDQPWHVRLIAVALAAFATGAIWTFLHNSETPPPTPAYIHIGAPPPPGTDHA